MDANVREDDATVARIAFEKSRGCRSARDCQDVVPWNAPWAMIADCWRGSGSGHAPWGGIRASIDQGPVTMGEVLTVLPFQNTLSTFQVKGATLLEALENGVSQVEEGAGRFPQVAGMHLTTRRQSHQ